MIELFWELRQQQGINEAQTAARETAGRVVSTESQLERLSRTVERLTLINMAMWSLIQDKTDLTEEDLIERVKEIDLEDGHADGRVTKTMAQCPKCKRPFSREHNKCLYCGHAEMAQTAFDAV